MGFWNDFAESFVPAFESSWEQERTLRAKKEMEDKRLAKQEELKREELKQRQKNMLLELYAKNGGRVGAPTGKGKQRVSDKDAEFIAQGQFLVQSGADEELVRNLMATQDTEALSSLVDDYRNVKQRYDELRQKVPEDLLNEALRNSVTIGAQKVEYNPADFFSSLGLNIEDYSFTQEEMALMEAGTQTVPGSAVVPSIPEPQDLVSVTELPKLKELIIEPSLDLAKKEFAGYKQMLVDLEKGGPLYEDLRGDEDEEAVKFFKELASERTTTLEQVLNQVKEGSHTSLLDIYGQNAFEEYDKYYNLTERGVPLPDFGGGSSIPQIQANGQEEYVDHVLGKYGISNYKYYTPE